MLPPFEILEHTADIGLKVHGRTLAELFVNAANGLLSLISAPGEQITSESGGRLTLSVNGSDLEDLLVNWLSEILYFIDAEGWELSEFSLRDIVVDPEGENRIAGEGLGQRLKLRERSRAIPVKAVTYHQISVQETSDGWEAVVYFDI